MVRHYKISVIDFPLYMPDAHVDDLFKSTPNMMLWNTGHWQSWQWYFGDNVRFVWVPNHLVYQLEWSDKVNDFSTLVYLISSVVAVVKSNQRYQSNMYSILSHTNLIHDVAYLWASSWLQDLPYPARLKRSASNFHKLKNQANLPIPLNISAKQWKHIAWWSNLKQNCRLFGQVLLIRM